MVPAVVSVLCCEDPRSFEPRKLSKYKHYRIGLLIYIPIYDDGSELRPRRT